MIGRPLAQAFPDRVGAVRREVTILDIAGLCRAIASARST